MRAIICGGRQFSDQAAAYRALDAFHAKRPLSFVIEGGAVGADRLGRQWAIKRGIAFQTFYADWDNLDRKAGPLRNAQMLNDGKPDVVLALPGNRGTEHMKRISRAAGVDVVELIPQANDESRQGRLF